MPFPWKIADVVQVVRGTMAAPLAQLLVVLDTGLRQALGMGAWRVLSRGPASAPATGCVRHAASLATVQHLCYEQPTLLIVDRVSGDEEVPLVRLSQQLEWNGLGPKSIAHRYYACRRLAVCPLHLFRIIFVQHELGIDIFPIPQNRQKLPVP